MSADGAIFISYRRLDSQAMADRIYDYLADRVGRERVFRDLDDIPPGVPFKTYIEDRIRASSVILVLIGPRWLERDVDTGRRRLDDAEDFVRLEIERALEAGVKLVPILVDGSHAPRADELPSSLRDLAGLQAATVRHARDFDGDMRRLFASLEYLLSPSRTATTAVEDGLLNADPEVVELLQELDRIETAAHRRAAIGDRLATVDDPRPGVGVGPDDLPDIAWCPIPVGVVLSATMQGWNPFRPKKIALGPFRLGAFKMARYPVTEAQFKRFVYAPDGYVNAEWWEDLVNDASSLPSPDLDNRPVTNITWFEAVAFCRWLSAQFRGQLPSDQCIRLPTEWEWQLAATAGGHGQEYAWGSEWEAGMANTSESHLQHATAAGMFPAGESPHGVQDMSGNVQEMCINAYRDYRDVGIRPDPTYRTVRGGSFQQDRLRACATYRYFVDPRWRLTDVGFRVVPSLDLRVEGVTPGSTEAD